MLLKHLNSFNIDTKLRDLRLSTKLTFPNYESKSGQLIRRYLEGKEFLSQKTINMIYSVNRYEHKADIETYLNWGSNVICDRYYFSNMAYGSFGQTTEEIEQMDSEMPNPDLVLYIDISPETSLERSGKNADKNEESLELLKHARVVYRELSINRNEWVVVNGEEDKEEIHEQVITLLKPILFNEDG